VLLSLSTPSCHTGGGGGESLAPLIPNPDFSEGVLPTSHLGCFSPEGNQVPFGWTVEPVRNIGEEASTSPEFPISSSC
jgi:hypothetical protein